MAKSPGNTVSRRRHAFEKLDALRELGWQRRNVIADHDRNLDPHAAGERPLGNEALEMRLFRAVCDAHRLR